MLTCSQPSFPRDDTPRRAAPPPGEPKRAELASCEQQLGRLEKAALGNGAGVTPSGSYVEGRAAGQPTAEPSTASAGSASGGLGELQVGPLLPCAH
jgi:hypothetical protein